MSEYQIINGMSQGGKRQIGAKLFEVLYLPEPVWPVLDSPSRFLGLFLAVDATCFPEETLKQFAKRAYESGLAYVCVWGQRSLKVETIFDLVYVHDEQSERRFTPKGDDDVLMTTSHHNDSLRNALFYFAYCAWPTEWYENETQYWPIMCIGNKDWVKRCHNWLNYLEAKQQKGDCVEGKDD